MKTRIITAIIGLVVILPMLIFANYYPGALLMQILGFFTVYELLSATGFRKKLSVGLPLYLVALGIPLFVFFEKTRPDFFKYTAILFFLIAFYLLTLTVFSKGKIKMEDLSILFIMSLYTLFSFNSIYLLRHENKGVFLFFLPFIVAWTTDTFAYFTGYFFGKHKLIPEISPKKTVEGAIGGLVGSTAILVLYGLFVDIFSNAVPNYLHLIIAGVVMSVASMAGDLIASLVKRHYQLKDYGKLLPGHGGILDRFDSVLAAAPLLIILYDLNIGFALFT